MTRTIFTLLFPMSLLLAACDKGDTDESQGPSERSAAAHGPRWLEKLDADKDGALSLAEVQGRPRLADRFAELDLDKDGKLDADELAAVKGKGRGRHGGKDPGARADHMLAKLDADKDGALSQAEVGDHRRLAEHFAELDADRDGKLSRDELAAIKGKGHHGEGRHHGDRDRHHGDPAEFAARKLEKLDADKDGALSQAEVKDHHRLADNFAELDADKNGKLSRDELIAMKGKGHHGDPAEFAARKLEKLDADRDGALSQDEVKGHHRLAERFADIDTDKNGKLSRDELAAMKARGHHGDGPRDEAAPAGAPVGPV